MAPNEIREDRRMKGRVVRLNNGFGFIEGEDGKDYFFHFSELSKFSKHFRNLDVGDNVDFQVGRSDRGPRAYDIVTIEGNAAPN